MKLNKLLITSRYIPYLIILLIVIFLTLSVTNMMARTLTLLSEKSWHSIDNLSINSKHLDDDYRVINFYKSGVATAVATMAGLPMIDGMRPNFTWRRAAFWFSTLPTKAIPEWHTHRHTMHKMDFEKKDLFKVLEMLNVKYILSGEALDDLDLESKSKEVLLCDISVACNLLNMFGMPISKIKTINGFYIYKLRNPWEKVFSASKINTSEYKEKTLEYFLQLKNLPYHSVLLANDSIFKNEDASTSNLILNNIIHQDGKFSFNSEGTGLVVLNQEFTSQWKAYCDGKQSKIFPVNGIMMASFIDSCNNFSFIFTE